MLAVFSNFIKQVRKVLWIRKAPACLLTLLYAYGKPRLCISIHSGLLQHDERWSVVMNTRSCEPQSTKH